ncbi:LamG-like jellyroll fold domain-containing protein [Marinifilum fragile]|uniref:LamG-like jellyroll fold domain-containing protein n=1 Tax=Marinifilum fragile TaxID=570161 RepID=UPI002AA86C94|nr:LamG-like jellyroll fold domain-containing protein [Marinifilum fragile]
MSISEPAVLLVTRATVTTPIACNGGDAEVTIVASGGTAPYTYTFNGVENTTDGVFTSKAGTYSYHVTDANGCSTTSTDLSISQPTPLTLTHESPTDVNCAGDATGAIDISVSGSETTALSFAGTNEGVKLNNSMNNLDGFTVEGWVKFDNVTAEYSLFGQNDLIEFSVRPTEFYVWVYTNSGGRNFSHPFDSSKLNDGQWHHLAVTGDHSQMVLYIDGMNVKSHGVTVDKYISQNPLDDERRPSIGANVTSGSSPYAFNGQISSVRYWTLARTNTQIKSAMSQRMTGSETGLFAAYRLDEGTGTTISGVGSNAGDVTISSNLNWQTSESIYSYSWEKGGTVIATTQDLINVSAGTYSVTVSTPGGCSKSLNDITINEPTVLDVNIAADNNTICEGEPVVVIATVSGGVAAYTYEFYLNGTQLTSNANYTISGNQLTSSAFANGDEIAVKVIDNNSCEKTSDKVVMTVSALPDPTIKGALSVCAEDPETPTDAELVNTEIYFTEAGMSNYTWTVTGGTIESGLGTNEITVKWKNAGTGTVSVNYENTNGCAATSAKSETITIYERPNPSSISTDF